MAPDAAGTVAVEVIVTDARGTVTRQTYDLTVTADDTAPTVDFFPLVTPAGVNEAVTLVTSAQDDTGVANLSVTVAGEALGLDTNGLSQYTPTVAGDLPVVVTAVDFAGNTTVENFILPVRDFNAINAPVVSFEPGLAHQVFTAPTDIVGSVTDADGDLRSYRVEVALIGTDQFQTIFEGTDEVREGAIGTFDPTLLQNDTYTVRLTAEDAGGNVSSVTETVGVEGNLKLGNFTLSFTDLSIPVSGIPITVTRTYDSLNANQTDDFGYGCRLEFRDTDLRTSLGPDDQYERFGVRSQAFDDNTRVYITVPGGERQGFTFAPKGDRLNRFFGAAPQAALYNPAFEADAGVTSTLTVRGNHRLTQGGDGKFYGLSGAGFNPADPLFGGVYILTTKEGIVYEIDGKSGDLLTVKDTNGNTLTFTDGEIFSDTGKSVLFERDAQGRVAKVIDPAGNRIEYGYDELGDLVAVTDRENNTTRFDYHDTRAHYLDEIIDPLGRSGVRSEYGNDGRLSRILDVNGEAIELIYDPDNSTETVLDVFGAPTTYVYDGRGNVVQEVDAIGKVTKYIFDDDNNLLTETVITEESGPQGYTITNTYDDQRNVLTSTDPLGHTTQFTYGAFNRLLSETDPLGHTSTYAYSGRGNLNTLTDVAGNSTAFDYDLRGNLLAITDPLGQRSQARYNDAGLVKTFTDAKSNRTTSKYDGNSNLIEETNTVTTPDGEQQVTTLWQYDKENLLRSFTNRENETITYEYDQQERLVAVIDALGRKTQYRYTVKDLVAETIIPDQTPGDDTDNPRPIDLYDRGDRLRASIDQAGQVTHFVYDALGRLVETIYADVNDTLDDLIAAVAPGQNLATIDWTQVIYPDTVPDYLRDNPRTRTEFYQDGQIKATIDERGNRTEYRYDAANRLIEVIQPSLSDDPKPYRTTYTYDGGDRRISQTDALGRTTTYHHDAFGRIITTQFVDGTTNHSTYNPLGHQIRTTDQNGNIIEYEYDQLDNLSAVVQFLDQDSDNPIALRTEYGYDDLNRLIWQEDAKDNRTHFEYDLVGRRTAVVLPEGQRSETTYNAVGNLTTYTDFNGDTTVYR
jgi:YD repeat-containing protein